MVHYVVRVGLCMVVLARVGIGVFLRQVGSFGMVWDASFIWLVWLRCRSCGPVWVQLVVRFVFNLSSVVVVEVWVVWLCWFGSFGPNWVHVGGWRVWLRRIGLFDTI